MKTAETKFETMCIANEIAPSVAVTAAASLMHTQQQQQKKNILCQL